MANFKDHLHWYSNKRKLGWKLDIHNIADLWLFSIGFLCGYNAARSSPEADESYQDFIYFCDYHIRKVPGHDMWDSDTVFSYIKRKFSDPQQGLDYFFDLFEQFQAHEASGAPPITLEDVQRLGASEEASENVW